MIPASFEESETYLGAPPGMESDCDPLSIARRVTEDGHPVVISCWKPTREELEEIQRTGRVWLMVWGQTMPPVALVGTKPL